MTVLLFTAGATVALLLGVYLSQTAWVLPVGLAGLVLFLGLSLVRRGRWLWLLRRVRVTALGVSLALLWLTLYGVVVLAPAQALEYRTVRLDAVVADWPQLVDHGVRITVRAGEEGQRKSKAVFYGDTDLMELRPGDRFSCVARCTPADRLRGEESLYYNAKGILLQIKGYGPVTVQAAEGLPLRYAMTILAGNLRQLLDALYDEPHDGFLRALLTGDKSGLSEENTHQFNRVGVGHVVVISGLHVSFLLGLLSLVIKPKNRLSLVVLVASLVLFSLMTGNAPGTVRAVVLGGIVLLGQYLGRESHPLVSLCVGLLLLVALNPYAIADAGLQFSFLSTLGIFLFGSPWALRWMEGVPRGWRWWAGPLLSSLAVSLGSMLPTVPLSALYFDRFSLLAPVANLLTGWAVSVIFTLGLLSLVAGAVFFPLGQLLAMVTAWPIDYFLWVCAWGSECSIASVGTDVPLYTAWMWFVYVVFFLYLFWPGRYKRPLVPLCAGGMTLCLTLILTVQSARQPDFSVTVLDVGQGQSVLLTAGDRCAMVDCGGTTAPGDTAATYLQSRGWQTLDLLVLTHYHEDHAGGVTELMRRVHVGTLVLPNVEPDDSRRQAIEALAETQEVPIVYVEEPSTVDMNGATLTLFPPLVGSEGSNELSLSVLFGWEDWEALITGDMPREQEIRLSARYPLPDVELLVVGHHGSRHSTGQVLLDAIQPELAAISVGYNSYGHPAPETLTRLENAGASIYRTDQMGTITFSKYQGG